MKRNFLLFLSVGLLALGFFSMVFAGGVGITNIGTRAVVMGSAFRGLADDWSATYWNPAGLTQIENPQVCLMAGFIIPKGTIKPYEPGTDFVGPVPLGASKGWATTEVSAVEQTFPIPSFGYVYPISERITFGFGFFVPFGLGARWDLFDLNAVFGYNSLSAGSYPQWDTDSDMQVLDFHPTLALKLSDKISLGAGLSILNGKMTIRQVQFVDSPLMGTPLGSAPYDKLVTDGLMEGEGWSFGANGGILLRPTESLSIGVSFRYYADVPMEGDATLTTYFPYDANKIAYIGDLMQSGALDSATGLQAQAAYSGQTKLSTPGVKADMPLPMEFGGGIAFRPSPKLTVTADVNWTQWSCWDVIKLKFDEDLDGDGVNDESELVSKWDDIIRLNFGAEYWAYQTESMDLAIRAGLYLDPSPIPDETIGPTIPDINNKTAILFGAGLKFGSLQLDANYETILTPDREVTTVGTHDGEVSNLPGKYTLGVNVIAAGVTYTF